MFKIPGLSIVCFLLISVHSISQQPVLSVQRFEYIWQPAIEASFKRLILASNDTIKQKIEKSFANALLQRWNITMPQNVLSVKPWSLLSLSDAPKFNTKLKDKQPNTWYLFLQIFDKGNPVLNYNDDSLVTGLNIKCRLIDGLNDSIIIDDDLLVKIYKKAAPPDQVLLTKLQTYPAHFIQAFDSIAAWTFQPNYETEKTVWLKPACVFMEDTTKAKPINQLLFKADDKNIQHLTEPFFSLHIIAPEYERTNAIKNAGGNTASGALTLFTGININKVRVYEYKADHSFVEGNSIYHCLINYAEKESSERQREKINNSDGSKSYSLKSGSYTLDERRIDSTLSNIITLDKDTVATFKIMYITKDNEHKSFTQFWNGTDSATIINLPKEWNNSKSDNNVIISGKIKDTAFLMKTSNGAISKKFYINDDLVLIMYGKPVPGKAILFQPLSAQQLKVFTILSSLPYAYFNYSAY